jgi:hypothetical protein
MLVILAALPLPGSHTAAAHAAGTSSAAARKPTPARRLLSRHPTGAPAPGTMLTASTTARPGPSSTARPLGRTPTTTALAAAGATTAGRPLAATPAKPARTVTTAGP